VTIDLAAEHAIAAGRADAKRNLLLSGVLALLATVTLVPSYLVYPDFASASETLLAVGAASFLATLMFGVPALAQLRATTKAKRALDAGNLPRARLLT
jgi:cobalamin biosynthesis protein CobD/CbiB